MTKVVDTTSKYQKVSKHYMKKMENFISSLKSASEIYDAFSHGDTRIVKSSRIESANYNPEWLKQIEDCMIDLGDIINNPRKVTKVETDIVPVELAKKTNDESVRHLASHSQYVKNITEKGDVIPDKILNIGADDDYITYENKFIATLIKRLILFVEKRYEYIAKNTPLKNVQVLKFKSTQSIDGSLVEIETKVRVTKVNTEVVPSLGEAYLKRIEEVRRYLKYYYTTDFMKLFKNEKDVHGQILQTNIIRKNPKYNHCYRLFKFIENYRDVGAEYNVKETYKDMNEEEIELVNQTILANFLALYPEKPSPEIFAKEVNVKPKIEKTIDDDMFTYSPILEENINFIRADENYQLGLESEIAEIRRNPSRQEANYQKVEAEKKKLIETRRKERDSLLKRHEKKEKAYLERQAELEEEERRRLEKLRKEEEERRRQILLKEIDKARGVLKDKAKNDPIKQLKPSKEEKDKTQKEDPKDKKEEAKVNE